MSAITSPSFGRTTSKPRSQFCLSPHRRFTPHAETVLSVRGLSKRFGGFLAINQVSFEVAEGEILGLIGPNGSGKSTTFNLIAGMLRPSSGSIRLAGKEISGLPAHRICRLGIGRTFQIPRPFRKLSLLENVTLAAYYGADGTISRGEARTRGGLDSTEMDRAADMLVNIRSQMGITIIWVEHIMGVLMRVVDRVIVLDHGEKIFEGAPEQVAKDPRVIEVYLGKGRTRP